MTGLPVISFFAPGLAFLPRWFEPKFVIPIAGMMTGQILAGIEPPVAVRHQIVVMCMTFGASGITAALYLSSIRRFA